MFTIAHYLYILYNFIFLHYFFFFIFPLKLFEFASSNLIDFNLRNDFNEYFFNFYSTFWTTIWYFLIYFLFLSFIFIVNSRPRVTYLLLTSVFTLTLMCMHELISFCITNINFNLFNNSVIIINFLLINTLNKYHPFLFYLSVASIFYFYTSLFYRNNSNYFFKTYFTNHLLKVISTCVVTIASSLVLGSWWAYQEGSWGGWWNWDPSETFGLFLFIIVILNIHFYSNFKNNFLIKNLFTLFIITFTLIYCFLQMSYTSISHNFGLKFFYFFDNNLFLTEIIIFGLVCFLINVALRCFFFTKCLTAMQAPIVVINLFKKKSNTLIFLISFITFIFSFKLLFFFFSWNLTPFNYLNINTLLNSFVMYLLLITYIFALKLNSFYFLIIWSIVFTLNFFIFIIKFNSFAHFLIFLHLLFNIFCFFISLSIYFYINIESLTHTFLQTNTMLFDWVYKSYSLNVYHIFSLNLNENYNLHIIDTLMDYLTKNLNLLKILYIDNVRYTETTTPLNYCANRIHVNSIEFYNEIILSTFIITILFIYSIIIDTIKFNKIIN